MDAGPAELTPAQTRTLALLRRTGDPVRFDPDVIDALTGEVREAFDAFAERIGTDRQLWISKHRLATVLACEANALAEEVFAWSPALAGGQVAHRAVQLSINWRAEPVPTVLVDEAIARLAAADSSLGEWLAHLDEADLADLRGHAIDRVTKFVETFPPLDPRARPLTESRIQWPVDGPVVLAGKVDLIIGRAVGDESRKVIVDLKTGPVRPQHREDLRFYALVETLRTGVPPRKLASFYLDAGDADVEDVTLGVLRSATRRTLDAIHALIELEIEGRPAEIRPGPTCTWCPLRPDCAPGQAHLERRAAGED